MQRHFLLLLLICCLSATGLSAQAVASGDLNQVPVLRLPAQDNAALLAAELAARAPGRAPHYAVPQTVDVSPANGGIWTDKGNGTSVWRLRVQSPGAESISLGFMEYWMPEKGELYLYRGGRKSPQIYGPFTPADNEVHNELWTQVIEGDDLVIEVQVPSAEKANLRLRLTTVLHDFLGFGANQSMSGSCNLDVVCAAADGWGIVDQYRDIIRSVAVIGTGGGTFCTGFLVNNARQDCTPYFMTANHCGINAGNAPSLVTYWNYENSVCRQPNTPASGGNGNGQLNVFNTGAVWRASNPGSDMTIVELDDDVHPDANAFFAGWSREMEEPGDTVIAVHHPRTDEKRISFSFQQTYRVAGISPNPNPNGGNIAVPDWDIGTTEGGSSGSPLFDRHKRVRGQLHGGGAACGNDAYDSYGYFFVSWEGGGTSSSRLKDWLDPDDTGVMFIDGKEQLSCQISVSSNAPAVTLCNGNEVTYDLLVGGGFTDQVSLTANGLPGGATATFSSNPVEPNTNVTLTVTYDGTVEGTTNFSVAATDGTASSNTNLSFTLEPAAPAAPTAISPANGTTDAPIVANLNWSNVSANTYEYEFGTDATLANTLASGSTDGTNFVYSTQLDSETQYYWRVRASNTCGFGPWSDIYSFTTANLVCGAANTNNSTIAIPDNSPANPAVSSIEVTSNGAIGFMTVSVEISHTYVGDLIASLIGPNGTEVLLFDRIGQPTSNFGCDGSNLELTFSDGAASTAEDLEGTCGNTPAASGEFQPIGSFSAFNGLEQAGNWELHVTDNAGQDLGSIDSWSITFCGAAGMSDYSAMVTSDPISTCANGNGNVVIALGQSWGANVDVSATVNGNALNGLTATQNGNNLNVAFANFLTLTSGTYDIVLTLTAEDGTVQNVTAPLTIDPVPSIAGQTSPANGTVTTDAAITFSWSAAANADNYTLQISRDETFASIDYSETTTATSLPVGLEVEGLQYWRVVANNECGNATGSPFNFTYNPNAVHDFADGRSLIVFPNPTSGRVFLDMKGNWDGDLEVNVMSIRGRVLSAQRLVAGGRQTLDVSQLPAGTYLLDMRNGTDRTVERLVILP